MRLILTFLSLIAALGYAAEKPVAVACAPFGEEIRMTIQGHPAKLRTPGKAADGKPWLWVAEFPGHLSAFENALVSAGWHVAFVDCHDQFGSPKAMATWEAPCRLRHFTRRIIHPRMGASSPRKNLRYLSRCRRG